MRSDRRLLTTAAFVGAFSFAATAEEPFQAVAQQDAPVATSTAATLPNFDLPVEPFDGRVTVATTAEPARSLAASADANDYRAFAAAYDAARARGEAGAAYADLHALWSYQQENPVGAWYGEEMHDRLARTYPGYASYIADFALVDSRGQTFYPSTETRRFLLQEARNGSTTRRALASPSTTSPATIRAAAAPRSTSPSRSSRAARAARRRFKKASVAPKTSPAAVAGASLVPAVAPAPPAAQTAAPVVAAAPAPAAPRTAAAAPRVAAAAMTGAMRPAQASLAADQPTARGLVLLVLGVVGVGILTLFMRVPAAADGTAPQSEPAMAKTPANVEPNVESITVRETQKQQRGARRATGSRG